MRKTKRAIVRKSNEVWRSCRFYKQAMIFTGLLSSEQVSFILRHSHTAPPDDIIAYTDYESVAVRLKPYAENAGEDAFFDFSFNYGENLFGNLEEGYEIVYMSYACHCAVWDYISLHRQNHFEHLDGVILYLNYCRKHHITVNRLFRKCRYRGEDLLHLRKEGKPWR